MAQDLTVRIGLEDDLSPALQNAIQSAESTRIAIESIADASADIDGLGDSLSGVASGVQEMTSSFEQANSVIAGSASGIDTLRTILDSADSTMAQVNESVSQTQSRFDALTADQQAMVAGMDEVNAAVSAQAESSAAWTDALATASSAVDQLAQAQQSEAASAEEMQNAELQAVEAIAQLTSTTDDAVTKAETGQDVIERAVDAVSRIEPAMNTASSALTAAETACDGLRLSMEQAADAILKSGEMTEEQNAAMQNAAIAADQAQAAFQNLSAAYNELDAYMRSGTQDLATLETLEQQLASATDDAASACDNAAQATAQLNEATLGAQSGLQSEAQAAQENAEATQQSVSATNAGADAFQLLGDVLGSLGLSLTFQQITSSLYEFTEAFEQATAAVMLATGATGDALEGLQTSMSNAFNAARNASLGDTATVIGELNTRLGYTGDQLSATTNQMLDFSNATGVDAGGSVRLVTQLLNQWNVDASDMGTILDQLTVAGQASGISIESLSQQLTTNKGVLDGYGFSLQEAMSLMMQFELSGTNVSRVMTGLNKALMSGAISSVDELYDVFEQIASGAMSAAEAADIFGTRSASAIMQAVQSGATNLDGFISQLENAGGAMETAAEASLTVGQKWEQATSKLQNAIGTAMQPAVDGFMEGLTNITNGIADAANACPALTAALTTVTTVVLGGAAAATTLKAVRTALANAATRQAAAEAILSTATTGSSVAMEAGTVAATGFGAAVQSAIWPITLVVAAIAGIGIGLGTWIKSMDDANDSMNQLTPTCRKQAEELHALEAELETLQNTDAEQSAIDDLTAKVDMERSAFEATKQTVAEFKEEINSVIEASQTAASDIDELLTRANSAPAKAGQYAKSFADIAKSTEGSVGHTAAMDGALRKIQETFPDVSVTARDFASDFEGSMQKMEEQMASTMNEDRLSDYMDAYARSTEQMAAIDEERQKILENKAAAEAELQQQISEGWGTNIDLESQISTYDESLAKLDAEYAQLADDARDATDGIRETSAAIEEADAAAQKSIDGFNGLYAALSGEGQSALASLRIVDQIKPQLEELGRAFDQAKQQATQSLQSMFDVWTKFKMPDDVLGINKLIQNVQKMNEVREQWSSNLDALEQKLDQTALSTQEKAAVMAEAAKGPAEAASLLEGSVEELQTLGQELSNLNIGNENMSVKLADIEVDASGLPDKVKQAMEGALNESGLSEGIKEPIRTAFSEAIDGLGEGDVSGFTGIADALKSAIESADMSDAGKTAATKIVEGLTTGLDTSSMEGFATSLGTQVTSALNDLTAFKDSGTKAAQQFGEGLSTASNIETDAQSAVNKAASSAEGAASSCKPAGVAISQNIGSGIASDDSPQTEAQNVVSEVETICSTANPTIHITVTSDSVPSSVSSIAGHAKGTRDAENVFIAGEEGPELIVGAAHSVVYTASETERILNSAKDYVNAIGNGGGIDLQSVADMYGSYTAPEPEVDMFEQLRKSGRDASERNVGGSDPLESVRSSEGQKPESNEVKHAHEGEVHYYIHIDGSGSISLDGVDEEDVLRIMHENSDAVFREMLMAQAYEEGQYAYGGG